jgi:hypothetical protein
MGIVGSTFKEESFNTALNDLTGQNPKAYNPDKIKQLFKMLRVKISELEDRIKHLEDSRTYK